MEIDTKLQDKGTAPFNMALNTLEKVHNILKQIVLVSSGYFIERSGEDLTPGKAQHVKYRLVRQLFIQSIPLFDKETTKDWVEKMRKKLWQIKPTISNNYKDNVVVSQFESYSEKLNDDLDDITIDIQAQLQLEGYFMPPKDDLRFTWKER